VTTPLPLPSTVRHNVWIVAPWRSSFSEVLLGDLIVESSGLYMAHLASPVRVLRMAVATSGSVIYVSSVMAASGFEGRPRYAFNIFARRAVPWSVSRVSGGGLEGHEVGDPAIVCHVLDDDEGKKGCP
jgi:hypothetical protein